MNFIEQDIPGTFLIEPSPFKDERGVFRRHFCAREFSRAGIVTNVLQSNISENLHFHTLRGFHYQQVPHGEGKTLTCLRGRLFDIVVDLRISSPTYMKWISVELDEENRNSVHVPPGCANAFLTLVENTIVYYVVSECYEPSAERGIRYNDPAFEFKWPAAPKHISSKDSSHPDFDSATGSYKV